uniref:Protein AMBP n=1 Tax=Sphaeramia orbicularis TaxID=375764 RepID=A0A673B4C7_9TELE
MMYKVMILGSLLVLGWTGTLQGLPVLSDPLFPTQENFDLTQFLGTWHDIAVGKKCSHAHQTPRGEAAIGKLDLATSTTENKLKMTRSVLRQGTCHQMSGDYELTSTPGRFFYHVAKWNADVDAYVVHTNYKEYAIMIMKKTRGLGDETTSVKLYSRTMDVRPTILEDFKTLARQQGLTDENITIKQNKGTTKTMSVSLTLLQRVRRYVVPTLKGPAEEVEGSGDDTPLFNGTEACKATPDTGPCFGTLRRYFYNSTSMSCEVFMFGGCLGNQNNFENERECLQRCRTEAVCRLPMVPQPCTGQPSIWAFDSTNGLCVPYKKGYCQGNGNKFYTKAECDEYCGVKTEITKL